MQQISLQAKARTEKGKSSARKARGEGIVPAVIYGKNMDSIPLSIQISALEKALSRGAAHKIVKLQIDRQGNSDEKLCVIHEIQKDTFGMRVLHVDFHHISMEEKITAKVPIRLHGEPQGAKAGGVLDHVLWEVEVEALPLNLPEKLEADVSSLGFHQAIHLKDLVLPEGVEILEDPEEIVAVVHPPRTEETPAVAAVAAEGAAATTTAATSAQPEVISKGKKEEEEAEEKPDKAKK